MYDAMGQGVAWKMVEDSLPSSLITSVRPALDGQDPRESHDLSAVLLGFVDWRDHIGDRREFLTLVDKARALGVH